MSQSLIIVEVHETDDAYLFTDLRIAEAFTDAINVQRGTEGEICEIVPDETCPIEPGVEAESMIAAERGDAIEAHTADDAWLEVSKEIREGISLRGVLADMGEIPGSASPGHHGLMRVLAEWIEADEERLSKPIHELARETLSAPAVESWRVAVLHTGGGVVVCAVEHHSDGSAPYAWVSEAENTSEGEFMVGIYRPADGGEPLSTDVISREELRDFVFDRLREVRASERRTDAPDPSFDLADAVEAAREMYEGGLIRDSQGREWLVSGVDSKDGQPALTGAGYWDYADQIELLKAPGLPKLATPCAVACINLAGYLNEQAEWNGGGVCEVLAQELRKAGFQIDG